MNCHICYCIIDDINIIVPLHRPSNKIFHWVCYECYKRIDNICPYCKV